MNPITRYILKIIVVLLLQVIALKNLELGAANWWLTPFIYFLLLADLPVKFNPLLAMLIGGALGFVVDIFYDTYGMHTSAAIFLAFGRYYLIDLILPRDGFDTGSSPTLKNLGRIKYITYILLLSIGYHLWFFVLEAFSFSSFLLRLSQALTSGIAAAILVIVLHHVFVNPAKR